MTSPLSPPIHIPHILAGYTHGATKPSSTKTRADSCQRCAPSTTAVSRSVCVLSKHSSDIAHIHILEGSPMLARRTKPHRCQHLYDSASLKSLEDLIMHSHMLPQILSLPEAEALVFNTASNKMRTPSALVMQTVLNAYLLDIVPSRRAHLSRNSYEARNTAAPSSAAS